MRASRTATWLQGASESADSEAATARRASRKASRKSASAMEAQAPAHHQSGHSTPEDTSPRIAAHTADDIAHASHLGVEQMPASTQDEGLPAAQRMPAVLQGPPQLPEMPDSFTSVMAPSRATVCVRPQQPERASRGGSLFAPRGSVANDLRRAAAGSYASSGRGAAASVSADGSANVSTAAGSVVHDGEGVAEYCARMSAGRQDIAGYNNALGAGGSHGAVAHAADTDTQQAGRLSAASATEWRAGSASMDRLSSVTLKVPAMEAAAF